MKTIDLSGIKVGPNEPVKIQGVINLSPESFYKGSVKTGPGEGTVIVTEVPVNNSSNETVRGAGHEKKARSAGR